MLLNGRKDPVMHQAKVPGPCGRIPLLIHNTGVCVCSRWMKLALTLCCYTIKVKVNTLQSSNHKSAINKRITCPTSEDFKTLLGSPVGAPWLGVPCKLAGPVRFKKHFGSMHRKVFKMCTPFDVVIICRAPFLQNCNRCKYLYKWKNLKIFHKGEMINKCWYFWSNSPNYREGLVLKNHSESNIKRKN